MHRNTGLTRRTPLRQKGKSDVAKTKDRIQALLRQLAIHRDGGCVLRHYKDEAGNCGGYAPKSGHLILQAEHLITRSNSVSYADMRNIVCLCQHHHGNFKPQHSRLYWELIERHIGPERWAFIKACEAERFKAHRTTLYDWTKIELALSQDLRQIEGEPQWDEQ